MTELLYLDDQYLREFSAKVIKVLEEGIVLDRTAFYPGGGGQPADTGKILFGGEESKVTGMIRGDEPVHVIEGKLPEIGQEIKGFIDWDRRYKVMRTHTAVHVISGVAYRDFGVVITGNQLYPGRARVDLSFENLSRDLVEEIIEKSNRVIEKDLPVRAYYLSKEEFLANPHLMRVNPKLYEKYERIRVIEIEGFDAQADGGTHVRRLGEIGKLALEKYESKGRKNKRIYVRLEDE